MDLQALRLAIKALASEETAAISQRFFKTGPGEYGEGDIFLGVRVPELRKLAKKCANYSVEQTLQLLRSKYHEERLLAVIIWVNQFKKADDKQKKAIYQAYLDNTQYINNWDIVDVSASHIVGGYLFDKPVTPLKRLVKSDDLWERRIAVIASFYFIRQQQYDVTLSLAAALLKDTHDLMHKAVGWMLREIANRDVKATEEFIKQHYAAMPRTMLRYAIERFPEEKRQAYLSGAVINKK